MSEKRLGWLKGAGTQYSMNLLKTEDNDRTHKSDVLCIIDVLTCGQCFFLDK